MNGYEYLSFDKTEGQLNHLFSLEFLQGKHLVYKFPNSCNLAFTEKDLLDLRDKIDKSLEYYQENDVTDKKVRDYNNKNKINAEAEYNAWLEKIKKREKPKPGYIYLIQNTESNALKIGFSKNPKARLKQLNIASHERLEILEFIEGTTNDERLLHNKFDHLRLNSEWFSYSEEIVQQFQIPKD